VRAYIRGMRFESKQDIQREQKAINLFLNESTKHKAVKLDENDVDFVIMQGKTPVSFVEVKGRNFPVRKSFPLPVSARKLVKLCDKKVNPIIIWACTDGIIYAKLEHLKGTLRMGGRSPRRGSPNDIELMVHFECNNETFKVKKYDN